MVPAVQSLIWQFSRTEKLLPLETARNLPRQRRVLLFGRTGDDPRVVGDWDGDGKADPSVYRSGASPGAQSFFFYRPSAQPSVDFVTIYWGTAGDEPVRGDFDGDRRMDAAVFRPSDSIWYILPSAAAQPRYERWGLSGDRLVAGDYDGDGRTDFAVWRAGNYNILQNLSSQAVYINFGVASDVPIASAFVR